MERWRGGKLEVSLVEGGRRQEEDVDVDVARHV